MTYLDPLFSTFGMYDLRPFNERVGGGEGGGTRHHFDIHTVADVRNPGWDGVGTGRNPLGACLGGLRPGTQRGLRVLIMPCSDREAYLSLAFYVSPTPRRLPTLSPTKFNKMMPSYLL